MKSPFLDRGPMVASFTAIKCLQGALEVLHCAGRFCVTSISWCHEYIYICICIYIYIEWYYVYDVVRFFRIPHNHI